MVEVGSRKLNVLTLSKCHTKPFPNIRLVRIVRNNNNNKINKKKERNRMDSRAFKLLRENKIG